MTIVAYAVLLAALAAIILMIAASIEIALRAANDDRVEQLAEKRFNEMLENAEVHVIQRLEIVDEMR